MNILLTTTFCLLLSLLIALCSANDNSSSNKPRDNKGTQQTSPYGTCGHTACFCVPGIPGIPGSSGTAGPTGAAGSPGNRGPEGPMGPRGNKGDEGARGKQGPKGATGPVGPSGNKGNEGARGKQGPRGSKGPSGPAGSLGPAGPPGKNGKAGARGIQGPPGFLGRNWKQCVFKNLNDDKDTGLIKECVFKKTSDKTALRVFWNGDFRLSNCHNCCRRWYFTFNGAECSAPAAIDGLVLVYHATSWKKNAHRPRHIEGICEKLHKGIMRVGFWVGNCVGRKSGDAYTGWNSVSRIYVEEVDSPQA